MAIKRQPKRQPAIESKLISMGYTGAPALRDSITGAPQHDAALKNWDSHLIDGKTILVKQFDGFFRYHEDTKKERSHQ